MYLLIGCGELCSDDVSFALDVGKLSPPPSDFLPSLDAVTSGTHLGSSFSTGEAGPPRETSFFSELGVFVDCGSAFGWEETRCVREPVFCGVEMLSRTTAFL